MKVVPDAASAGRQVRPRIPKGAGDLDQPDSGLGRLDLAEEGTEVLELVATPVAKETRGLRSHAPLRLRQTPPTVHLLPDLVDDGIRVVLLFLGGQLLLPKRQPKLDGFSALGLGAGAGEMNFAVRRVSTISLVGNPRWSSFQCRPGYA